MHKQCSTFKNVLNLRYLFFVIYLIFQKIKVRIIFKHLFLISIPSKTLATSSQYVRKLAIFALIYCMPRLKLAHTMKDMQNLRGRSHILQCQFLPMIKLFIHSTFHRFWCTNIHWLSLIQFWFLEGIIYIIIITVLNYCPPKM